MAATTASTLARIARTLEALDARLSALETAKPVVSAPAQAKAASPARSKFFDEVIVARAQAKVACTIHDGSICNRTFSPASSGRENHVARKS